MVGGPSLAVVIGALLVPFAVMGGVWLLGRLLVGGDDEAENERNVPETVNHQARTIPGGRSD
jgi:hypothetical protein